MRSGTAASFSCRPCGTHCVSEPRSSKLCDCESCQRERGSCACVACRCRVRAPWIQGFFPAESSPMSNKLWADEATASLHSCQWQPPVGAANEGPLIDSFKLFLQLQSHFHLAVRHPPPPLWPDGVSGHNAEVQDPNRPRSTRSVEANHLPFRLLPLVVRLSHHERWQLPPAKATLGPVSKGVEEAMPGLVFTSRRLAAASGSSTVSSELVRA